MSHSSDQHPQQPSAKDQSRPAPTGLRPIEAESNQQPQLDQVPPADPQPPSDPVDESSWESFPASDAPAH